MNRSVSANNDSPSLSITTRPQTLTRLHRCTPLLLGARILAYSRAMHGALPQDCAHRACTIGPMWHGRRTSRAFLSCTSDKPGLRRTMFPNSGACPLPSAQSSSSCHQPTPCNVSAHPDGGRRQEGGRREGKREGARAGGREGGRGAREGRGEEGGLET